MTKMTRHLIIDVKTGFAYGMRLDENGVCHAVQPLNTAIETLDGRFVTKLGPLVVAPNCPETLPYGQTTHAVEITPLDGQSGKLFTLVWPTKENAGLGILPVVTGRPFPLGLAENGIDAAAKTNPKNTSVDVGNAGPSKARSRAFNL